MSTKTIVIFSLISLLIFSCKKDFFIEGGDGKLSFSNDSIIFDTVFTSVGSITKTFKIYNPNNSAVKIKNINLLNSNNNSVYRINIDGKPFDQFQELTIASNDSLYVFVEATINPNSTSLPFLISDSIQISTQSYTNFIKLIAYGQNANFHLAEPQDISIINQNNDTIIPSYISIDGNNPKIWNNDLPHVVYGYVIIEPGAELIIEEGTKIYFHNNSGLIVGNPFKTQNGGKLTVNGTLENKVIFQGDRLDEYYKDAPAQWDRIWISKGSFNNSINHAIIKNSIVGIQSDTIGSVNVPTLTINNTIIENASDIGMFAQGSHIVGNNNLITNCGRYSLVLNIGGQYDFNHCTFANFYEFDNRNTPSILINNYYEDFNGNIQPRALTEALFTNCIFSGNLEHEIILQENTSVDFNYQFNHCLLKIHSDSSISNYAQTESQKISSNSELFEDYFNNDFLPKENSQAIDNGIPTEIDIDINGISRTPLPDIGALEREN